MGLLDDLERTKLKFMQVAEQLIKEGQLSEADMEHMLAVFDAMDSMDEEAVMAAMVEMVGSEDVVRMYQRMEVLDKGFGTS